MSECVGGKERVHGSTARADGGRSPIAGSEPRHAATVPPVCGAVRRVPPTITEGTWGIGDPCVSRSPRPGETRESFDARGVRRGDPFSLPGDLGPPRRGATHPLPRRVRERLPEILSVAEVERLLCAVSRPKHRAMLMVAYGWADL